MSGESVERVLGAARSDVADERLDRTMAEIDANSAVSPTHGAAAFPVPDDSLPGESSGYAELDAAVRASARIADFERQLGVERARRRDLLRQAIRAGVPVVEAARALGMTRQRVYELTR